ncbi:hypothetical protein I8748_30070 [Nostoc sp. CENA67]|uniref:Uncharacterized protein n=1 Tax=Amazonocrinis nigriterrae CENA67 TaxID=2794033 RepID=A0A8J7HV38_9NOST|nr:hypothetical protein [Amazonocrinis nigriterrae]MBH8566351.1 hypothetical protein [Amazonocrinis nigriterrae CENA67]
MSKTVLAQASLTLYAYHLRTDISKGAEQLSDEADQIWEGLVELGKTLNISLLQNLKQKLICYNSHGEYEPTAENQLIFQRGSLLKPENKDFKFDLIRSITGKNLKLNGELGAFRLHDTYAIDLTLSCDDTISINELKQLNPKELLPPQYIQASIGQTLFLYGKLAAPCEDDEQLEKLADDYVAQLMVDGIQLELNSKGKLLNNLIFEYETLEIDSSKRCHLLIWFINQYTPTEKQFKQVFPHLLTLLCARHKILSAYNDYQPYNNEAKNLYSQLEEYVKNFENIATNQSYKLEDRLKEFKKLLAILATKAIDYSKCLWYIADYETTIATNIKNYESSYKKLRKLPHNNLSFLEEFIELTHNTYEAQLQIERQYLEPDAKLLQQLIDTIRGMVAVDQAELEDKKAKHDREHEAKAQEREKKLELLIAGVGAGLAFSSVSAAVMPKPSETLPPGFKCSIGGFSFLIDVGFHLLGGLIFGRCIVLILEKIRSSSSN